MPRKKTILDRRERIIETADRLFSHFGYEKTTMEDISRESGIPRATVYLEFSGGKEDILMASIGRFLDEMLSTMRDLARQSRTSRLDTLKRLVLFSILSAYDRSTSHHCDPSKTDRCLRVREEMAGFFKNRAALFAELLRQAALAGEISITKDFQRISDLICQGMSGFMPPFSIQFERETLEHDADAFFSLLLTGLVRMNRRPALMS